MVTKIFQLLLLLSPICIGTNIDMDMFDLTFFRMGIVALFLASMFDKPRREISREITLTMASLLGLVFTNVFIHAFTPVGLHTSLNLFLAALGFGIVYIHYDKTKSLNNYILAAAAINFAFFVIQKIGFDPVWNVHPYKGQEGAFLGNQPRLVMYFALITPFIPVWLLPLSVAVGVFAKQYVIFIPVMIVLWSKTKSDREKILLGIMSLLLLYPIRKHVFDSLQFRFNLAWAPALCSFFKQPLIGLGIGERPFPELGILGNSYFQFIVGVGILGAVWLVYALNLVRKNARNVLATIEGRAFVSLLVIMFIKYPLEIPRLWFLDLAIVVMFLLKILNTKEAQCQTA